MVMPSWVATVIDFQNNFPWPYSFGWLWQLGCLEYSHAFPTPQKLIQNNFHDDISPRANISEPFLFNYLNR